MFSEKKAQKRLSLLVTLALSTGGACLTMGVDSPWGESVAHAEEHEYTETATSINGLEGTDKTGFMSDNKITLGTEGGPTDKPFSTWGTISGGGKKNATEDVSNNTLTIHGLKVSNGGGQSMIYGGVSGTGAVTNNRVFFNNGLSKDPIYGGFNGASATKAVTGNSVTVAGGTVEGDAFGGYTTGKGAVTGNSVTIKGGSLGDEAAGGVIGNSSSSADASGNTLTISGGAFTKSGGTNVFGAYNAGSGKTINNIVNLGDGENAMASGFDLTRVKIYGGNKTNDVTGNTLNVNASGIVVRTAQNFEKYNFNLTKGVAAGSTMLKVTDSGGFGSTPDVQWKNITMSAEGWNADTTKYGRLGTMELLRTGSGADLKIFNTEALDRKATSGDFEYHMYTDVTTPPMSFFGYNMVNYVRADIDRFQNADATADNVTGTEVYGGYSSLGNTTTNNKIKITNTNNTNLNVYGGYTAGAGDSTNNHVTITATGKVKAAYGGYATAANSKAEGNSVTVETSGWVDNTSYAGWAKGAVNRNIFTVKGHADWSVFGGKLDGGGTAEGNEVRVDGGTVNGHAIGAQGGTDAVVTGNKVTVTNGTVKKNITGGQSAGGNGKATRNVVAITGSTIEENVSGGLVANSGTVSDNQVSISDSVIKKNVHGGYDPASGTVTGNNVAVSGSSTVEDVLYGGCSLDSGRVTGNTVNISDGTFKKRIFGGYSDKSGTVTENKVTITGGRFEGVVYGGAGGDSSGSGTFTVNKNVVTVAGGTFSGNIYGAYSWRNDSTTEGNTVNLGDDTHHDLSGATLTASEIYGGNKAATGNTLNVNAKNIAAKSVNKFENYNFKLNESFGNGDTMLSVANAGDFGGTGVDWRKISVDRSGLSADYVSNVHGVHRVTLLKSATANALNFSNYATTIYAATDTHESAVQTDTDSGTATSVFMEINRFKNGRVTYDGTGETYAKTWGNEIYGGLSHDGHTTTGNQLTVKALRGAGDPSHVFGGKNEGTTGDVTQNTVDIELAHDADTIAEVYGGQANNVDGVGKVDGNIANMKKGTVNLLYAGYTFGDGAVTNNTVNFSGGKSTGYIGGGYIDKATSKAEVSYNKVLFTDGTAGQIRGGVTIGSGAAKKNAVEFSAGTAMGIRGAEIEGGTAEENEVAVKGGTVSGDVYGAETSGTGEAKKNTVTISGGTVNAEVAGGVGYKATANIVTLTGGTVSGNVYGGKSVGPGSSTSENIVNLGAEDGTYTANLDNASIYGDNSTDSAVNNNTLNVFGKGITVHSVKNFDKYNFKLNNNIASGDTMLTLHNGGFGREIDFANNFNVDTSKLTGKPTGTITLLKSETVNALTFKDGYVPRDLGSTENAEYFIGTDTGTRTATSVIMNYNIFRNNEWTYDGTNPTTANEVAGGISYRDGNTTENNQITVKGAPADVPTHKLTFVYGGKTNGAADSKKNRVIVESTGNGSIDNINGGYTGATNGMASENRVLIKDGTVKNAMGGAVSGASGSATGNEVVVEGGTVTQGVIGGGGSNAAAGNISDNKVTITGGTVSGQIVGGYSRNADSMSNKNIVTLGGGNLSGAEVWGSAYYNASNQATVLANTDDKIKGNTLNVQAAGLTVKKIRNFEKLNFKMTDALHNGATMLELSEAGGFGKLSSDNTDVRVKWTNVTVDLPENLNALQGKNKITLLKALASGKLKFSEYALDPKIQGNYETVTHLDANATVNPDKTADATSVELSLNRFKNGNRTLNAASTLDNNEFYAGISEYGAGTEYNHLEIDAAPASLDASYAGKTEGEAGGSHHNELVVKGNAGITARSFIAAGYIHNVDNTADAADNVTTLTETDAANVFTGKVFGGKTEGTGNALRNTVNVLRKVTGDIVGGYAAKGAASYNTVNLGAVDVTGDVYGGQVEPVQPNVQTRNNTINLFGTKVTGKVFGGNKEAVGNTLAVHAPGTEINDFENIENLNFYLPEGASAAMPTMLKLGTDTKDIRGLKLGVGLAGGARTLKANDTLSLMKVAEKLDHTSGTLTTDDTLTNALEGQQGVSMRYKFALAKRGTDELVATVSEAKMNEATKSLVETRAAAMDFYNSGINNLVGSGLPAAASAVAAEAAESGKAGGPASSGAATDYAAWVAQSGTSMKVKTGSYADVRGYNLNVGFARKIAQKDGTLLFGPFVEYGRGNYDSYLDDGTHGDGKTRYIGAGLLARKDGQDGTYFEGSIRAGRMKSDYTGNIAGVDTSYDVSHPYYGFHLGLGRVTKLKGGSSVDTYLKYFYAHQNDADATLATGETYKFDDVNSSRLRLGVRYTKGDNPENQVYAGIAWEYEFDGDARASYQGMDTPSPSLKGSSGVLELGARFAPKDSNVSYELNLNGWAGKRRGVSGGVSVNWAF